jgi:Na+-transporting NADH:ubiquinone oxidoreductase subunit NqrD
MGAAAGRPAGPDHAGVFYGWVIVGAGIVVTCVGFGAMFSLEVFLQPMSETMGWSRTGISAAGPLAPSVAH